MPSCRVSHDGYERNGIFKSLLFWDVTQRRLIVSYRRFGTTNHSHLQGSISPRILRLIGL